MIVEPIPIYTSNYVWVLHNRRQAWVVDPGDQIPVIDFLRAHQLDLEGILITHHHWDHITGCKPLIEALSQPHLPVYGPHHPNHSIVNHPLKDLDTLAIFNHQITVLQTPGHTADHICFWFPEEAILFSGDTLFNAGCGRLFDASADELFHSLQRISELPEHTRVYCTHEYTLDNLAFAERVQGDCPNLKQAIKDNQSLRQRGLPTIPFSLGGQHMINPFLKTGQRDVQSAIEHHINQKPKSEADYFAALRTWKDQLR